MLLYVCAAYFAGLGVYGQGATLVGDVPKYAQGIGDLSDGVVTKLESIEEAAYALVVPKRLSETRQKNLPAKKRGMVKPLKVVTPTREVQEVRILPEHRRSLMSSIRIVRAVRRMSWRDHIRPAVLQLFEGPDQVVAAASLDAIASIVRRFVVRATISEAEVQVAKWKSIKQRSDFRRRCRMFPLSVLGGLFLVGYGISRVRAKQGRKPSVQTLFGKK